MSTGIKELMIATSQLPACKDVFMQTGQQVVTMWGGSAKLIERFVRELSELSGQPVDWHYVGGRAVVLTTGHLTKVKDTMREMRFYFSTDM